jgi:hypothetical protein
MTTTDHSKTPQVAFIILALQVISWLLILSPYFDDFSTSSDAAGAGMRGIGLFLVGVPCMAFIFFTTFYFFKKSLSRWFRLVYTFNVIGLLIVISQANW